MSGHGGKRPGAGRKPGKVSKAKRELMDMAKDHAEIALQTLVDITTHGETESARVSAANAILDRGYGRPVQGVDHTSKGEAIRMPSLIQFVGIDDNGED